VDHQVGVAFGALRPLGGLSVRATVLAATDVGAWAPQLHAGFSLALALTTRWIALAEVMADSSRDGTTVSAGPTVKAAIGESLGLMAGALFEVGGPAMPAFVLQLTQSF
jgi:hypothetical protein